MKVAAQNAVAFQAFRQSREANNCTRNKNSIRCGHAAPDPPLKAFSSRVPRLLQGRWQPTLDIRLNIVRFREEVPKSLALTPPPIVHHDLTGGRVGAHRIAQSEHPTDHRQHTHGKG